MFIERRQHSRVKTVVPAQLTEVCGGLRVKPKLATCRNLSAGGALCISSEPLGEGLLITVELHLPDAVLRGQAVVVRCEQSEETGMYHVATAFVEHSQEFKNRLIGFVRAMAAEAQ